MHTVFANILQVASISSLECCKFEVRPPPTKLVDTHDVVEAQPA